LSVKLKDFFSILVFT